jgi:hypothetical protein
MDIFNLFFWEICGSKACENIIRKKLKVKENFM